MSSTEILALVITLIGPVIIALAVDLAQLLLAHLPMAKNAQLRQIVADVVHAVEQAQQQVPGAEKKRIALGLIGTLLAQAHIAASAEQTDVLLEAAVHAINSALPAAATPAATPSP